MKKLFKVILCMAIILSNFSPLFSVKVKAAGDYQVLIAYPSDDSTNLSKNDVSLNYYTTYADALAAMNNYVAASPLGVPYIKYDNKIINAKYAIAQQDVVNGTVASKGNDAIKWLYSTASGAKNSISSDRIVSFAGAWGCDSVFLDYDNANSAVKIKISGVTGWVKLSDVIVIPLSRFYGSTLNYPSNNPKVKINTTASNVRSDPNAKANIVASVYNGSSYIYYPSKTIAADGYTWYYIQYSNGNYGYVAQDSSSTYLTIINTYKSDTFYYSFGNNIFHQIHKGNNYISEANIRLGTAPFYYKTGIKTYYLNTLGSVTFGNNNIPNVSSDYRYYSFDGNYFYTSMFSMIDDYKAATYAKSLNYEHPYFAYFQYSPSRTVTAYTGDQLNVLTASYSISGFPTNPSSYVDGTTGAFIKNIGNLSMMYGIGNQFISAGTSYGVNALTLYSAAAQESNYGRSSIAFYKNNLFGMGATDAAPFTNAIPYPSTQASINDYANKISSGSYATLTTTVYGGTHFGNKLSGQNISYATDPYSGESKASVAFASDLSSGGSDNYSNTLGITLNNTTPINIYSNPSSSSSVIYSTKNYSSGKTLSNMPFVVTDKVLATDGTNTYYYKVYTDVTLTSNRVVSYSDADVYNYAYCYGYIKASDLYVANNQPVITASNKTVTQHDSVRLLTGVTANDIEDGNLTSSVTVSNTGGFDAEKPGTYTITYTVMDKSKYSVSKDITITVEPSGIPTIVAPDITIPQYKSFDPKTGVTVEDIDAADKDLINKLTVTGTVDVSTIGDYTLTYMVTDAAGSTDTATRKVTVVANEKPVINANNLTVYKGQTFNYLNGITATDKEDGNVTSSLSYTGTVDMATKGTYEVTYSAKDLDNQTSSKTVTITVEDKIYKAAASMFYLSNLTYNTTTKKVDFTGYLTIKGMNNTASTNITYDIIFENQNNGNTIIKPLSRLASKDAPFAVPNSGGFNYSESWFKEALDLTDLVSGDYTVYVRARSGDYEAKVPLKNEYFNTKVVRKFAIDNVGYQFRINYYNRSLPLELYVRSNGLVAKVNNPTIDNMYNQVYSIKLNGTKLNLEASSHNVQGNYASNQTIERYVMFENVDTLEIAKTVNVGAITNGPYKVNLKVSDGYDKTKVWYNTSIDLADLPKGTYSVIVRTKAGAIDDYGELYDVLYKNDINQSQTIGDKKITITRHNELRYRIEITVE